MHCEGEPAMQPRSYVTGGEVYHCGGRITHGLDSCPLAPIPRALIDEAVFRYFERVGLDWEATRSALEAALEERLVEVRELRRQAEKDARTAEGDLARMRERFVAGELGTDEWREFPDELTAARDAATAKLDRLSEHERQLIEGGPVKDAEAETYRRMAEIRAAIAGDVRDAAGLEEVRAALRRLFERFLILRVDAVDPTYVEDDVTLRHEGAEYVIWPGAPRGRDRVGVRGRAGVSLARCGRALRRSRGGAVAPRAAEGGARQWPKQRTRGLDHVVSAPRRSPNTRSERSPLAVRRITDTGPWSRRRRMTSSPSMPGSIRSRITRSGASLPASRSASRPSHAVRVR
jgi:hypothetical protein